MAYCAGTDILNLALPIQALQSNLVSAQVSAACQRASDFADTFFRGRWGYTAVPLLAWDSSITGAAATIAAFWLMTGPRGVKFNSDEWKLLKSAYDEQVKFLNAVQRQQAHPLVTLANANAPGGAQPILSTSSLVNTATGAHARNRGW